MTPQLHGIHHVTAIASDPQRNIDFYAGILGLRLVKVTVNFDDPGTYHLYYGDAAGTPGTLLTFFPWAGARRGRRGTGQVAATAFSIPEHAVSYWIERLKWHGVTVGDPAARLDEEVLVFFDPDGLALELVAHAGAVELPAWERGPVPADQAIRGFHGVTLWEEEYAPSASVLAETLGFGLAAQEGNRYRHRAQGGGIAALVDVLHVPKGQWGQGGAGTVHHVAWRTPDDAQQLAWQRKIAEAGLSVTPVQDRQYFHSIYFREPGGVLYEVATNPPGFAIDEPLDRLGAGLMLPPWLEPQRRQIEESLPTIQRPALREDGNV